MWPFNQTKTREVATLTSLLDSYPSPIAAVPPEVEPTDALPCERMHLAPPEESPLDVRWFREVAKALGRPVRAISPESLLRTRPGHLGLQMPLFNSIDPYFDHGLSFRKFIADMCEFADRLASTRPAYFEDEFRKLKGSGVLVGRVGATTVQQFADGRELRTPVTTAAHNAWLKSSGDYAYVCYSTIPGMIKPEDRKKIADAREIARSVRGELRLITEATWILAGESPPGPKPRDPLIVIRNGDLTAYIDRFDCTSLEESLAREHAVRVD